MLFQNIMLFIFPLHTVKMRLVFWHQSFQFAVPCLILDRGGVDRQRIKMYILSYGFRRLGAQDHYYSFYGVVLYFDFELDRTWLQSTAVKWKKKT